MLSILLGATVAGIAAAQQAGTLQAENHPALTWQKCTASSCTTTNGKVVIDSNWRWLHDVSSSTNCYTGNTWGSVCSTATDCAAKCALEGADYAATYGATTSGNALTLKFVTQTAYGPNVGSRLYLMASDTAYQTFTLLNNELAFDVDLSTVGCGLNAALYFVAMQADGGMASYPTNKAGAKFGTGYCDAQCARDLKFVGGKANVEGWVPSSNDPNAGVGPMGACCSEIDIWESNSHSFALTPHPCQNNNYHVCTTTGCGGTYSADRFAGDCDANGCDYNPYRTGNTNFYGSGKTLNTASKFTVVTQFKANNLTQFFVQNGKKITIPGPTIAGFPAGSSITPAYCTAEFSVFGDRARFTEVGGFNQVNAALSLPMVLVMSIWDDHYANMLWLDSTYPVDKTSPGGPRGDCATTSGVPSEVESTQGNSQVVWSNIRFGPIGSTVKV